MPEEKEITIYDIAKLLNISATTVSRGLKDHPSINKSTRKKIQDLALKLGYRSNTFASSLRNKYTHTIGVIIPRLNSYFVASVIAGIEKIANESGYNLIISQSQEKYQKEILNAKTMFNNRVDGLLVSLAYDTENIAHFDQFIKRGTPIVFFDRVNMNNQCLGIVIDNYKSAYEITTHLVNQGCRKVMHLGGNLSRNVYADRLRGYKQALADNKIIFDPKYVLINDLSEEAGIQAGELILKMKTRPDGVFAANDTCAVFCMKTLKQAKIKIPEEIAFAGFNNDPLSKVVEPNLTTVNYPGYEMGKTAASQLIGHLNGTLNLKSTNIIILRSELIIRESSLKKRLEA